MCGSCAIKLLKWDRENTKATFEVMEKSYEKYLNNYGVFGHLYNNHILKTGLKVSYN